MSSESNAREDARMQRVINRDTSIFGRATNAAIDLGRTFVGKSSIWHEVRAWEVRQENRKSHDPYLKDVKSGVDLVKAWHSHQRRVGVEPDPVQKPRSLALLVASQPPSRVDTGKPRPSRSAGIER